MYFSLSDGKYHEGKQVSSFFERWSSASIDWHARIMFKLWIMFAEFFLMYRNKSGFWSIFLFIYKTLYCSGHLTPLMCAYIEWFQCSYNICCISYSWAYLGRIMELWKLFLRNFHYRNYFFRRNNYQFFHA